MAGRSQLSDNWRATAQISSPSPSNTERHDSRPHAPSSETLRGEDDPRTLQAIEEGRRLYVGNLPYMAKTRDVEELFVRNGYHIEHINMSIDPYSGRNPSYCFVELISKAQADHAMQELNGKDLLGRRVKLGPGVARPPKRKAMDQSSRRGSPARPVFQRWTRTDASDHFRGYSEQGRRLWVGGLPKMGEHGAVNAGVRELFAGFEIEAVSKVIIPATPALGDPKAWNHRYLFVDFANADEARQAAKATDGRHAWGVKIRVQLANSADSRKPRERDEWDEESLASLRS